MAIWHELKRRLRDVVPPVLGFCVVGYFAYHSLEGERGLFAFVRLTEQIREARAHLDELQAERQALDRRVSLLRPEHLDRDMLEERARLLLNYTRPDEIVILDRAPDMAPPPPRR